MVDLSGLEVCLVPGQQQQARPGRHRLTKNTGHVLGFGGLKLNFGENIV